MNACLRPYPELNIKRAAGANICHLCRLTSTLNLHHRKNPLYWQLLFQRSAKKSQRTEQCRKTEGEEKDRRKTTPMTTATAKGQQEVEYE